MSDSKGGGNDPSKECGWGYCTAAASVVLRNTYNSRTLISCNPCAESTGDNWEIKRSLDTDTEQDGGNA